MENINESPRHYLPWNKGKLVGPKPPLKLREVWAIRVRLQLAHRVRDLALFNLALDTKLLGCDLISLKVSDITLGSGIANRAAVFQRKTQRPVQFEITEQTRSAVSAWIGTKRLRPADYLFPSRHRTEAHLSTRQYGRTDKWIKPIGLDPAGFGTHTMRRTKPTLIYRRTKNLRQFSFYLGTRRWKARYAISVLRWTMPSRWRSRLKADRLAEPSAFDPKRDIR